MDYNVDCESEDGSNIFYLISLIEYRRKKADEKMPRLPSLWWFGYFLNSYNVLGKFKKSYSQVLALVQVNP